MNSIELETTRNRPAVCCAIAVLAAAMCALLLLNVAELQSAAMITVRTQAPEASERPALDIGLLLIAAAGIAPVAVLSIALVKRWSLSYYLAWVVATVLLVLVISAAAAFVTYRYWREHQAVAELSTSDVKVQNLPKEDLGSKT
jgi:glucan phosphoethanolaminetransferase (alkaline phosphatase superfamily)